MFRWLALFVCLALPLKAEEVVLGLSQDEIAITTTFDGSQILIFGAIKRDAPVPDGAPLEVLITLAGPDEPVSVWRKGRVAGIWANVESVDVDAAPSFYAILSSAPMAEALSEIEDLRHNVTIPKAIRSVGAPMDVTNAENFTDALIRIRSEAGLYQVLESSVTVEEDTLFRGQVSLPANLSEGPYAIRIFLTRGGVVVDQFEKTISVSKVGLERWLYELSRNMPLIYGLMSLAIAIAAGWLASAAFRLLQR